MGCGKQTGSYRTYSSLVKLQPCFLSLRWKTFLLVELQPKFLHLLWRTCSWAELSDDDAIVKFTFCQFDNLLMKKAFKIKKNWLFKHSFFSFLLIHWIQHPKEEGNSLDHIWTRTMEGLPWRLISAEHRRSSLDGTNTLDDGNVVWRLKWNSTLAFASVTMESPRKNYRLAGIADWIHNFQNVSPARYRGITSLVE